MARHYHQGKFTPKNPNKYIGTEEPFARSGWEIQFMNFLDTHPSILQWASESIQIPYKHPLTGKNTIYIPDFLIVYIDRHGKQHCELVEVKPLREACNEEAKTKRDKAYLAVNMAKWQAAVIWAKKHGVDFRIVTERDLFAK